MADQAESVGHPNSVLGALMHRLKRTTSLLWLLPAVVLIGGFVYYPILDNFRLSVLDWSAFSPNDQKFVGLDNFRKAFSDPVVAIAFKNNIAYAVVSVVVQVGGGLVLAALLDQFMKGKVRAFFQSVYFLPATISITVTSVLFTFIYHPDIGLLNSGLKAIGLGNLAQGWLGNAKTAIWAVIAMSQWQWTGYIAVLLLVAMQRIPREFYEAAALDGAGRIRQFFNITVPLVRDTATILTIVTISNAFLVFNEVTAMTNGGPNNASQVLGTWIYQNAFVNDRMGYAAAISSLVLLLTTGIAVVQLVYSQKKRVEY
jgi:raffinose/stachyose/melibiose transport system permease protein